MEPSYLELVTALLNKSGPNLSLHCLEPPNVMAVQYQKTLKTQEKSPACWCKRGSWPSDLRFFVNLLLVHELVGPIKQSFDAVSW